eukprot:6913255-Alexandrium_andersonii.AAC.1
MGSQRLVTPRAAFPWLLGFTVGVPRGVCWPRHRNSDVRVRNAAQPREAFFSLGQQQPLYVADRQ